MPGPAVSGSHKFLLPLTLLVAVGSSLVAVTAPKVLLAFLAAVALVAVLAALRDNWRRALVVTITAMFSGASGIDVLTAHSGILMAAAMGLLFIVTMSEKQVATSAFSSVTHQFTIRLLWLTSALALISTTWSHDRPETLTHSLVLLCMTIILHRVTPVQLSGTALSPDHGTPPGDRLVWTSSLDGVLGVGTDLVVASLRPGWHRITLTAPQDDECGAEVTAAVCIEVAEPEPDDA
jgi:hypothetical protein